MLDLVGSDDRHTSVPPSAVNASESTRPHMAVNGAGSASPGRATQISVPSSLVIAIATCAPSRSVATAHDE